jgi:mannose-6-phosphate isomerase-like protein (cupin superfamily)
MPDTPSRQQILDGIARYADLRHAERAFLDNIVEGHIRENFNLVGTTAGANDPDGRYPLGAAGFSIGFQRAEPGNGPGLHSHLAVEVFIILVGRWRLYWLDQDGEGSAELGPFDAASIPATVWRGLEVVGHEPGVLLAVRDRFDGGGIDWHPSIIEAAENAGRVLVDGQIAQ